MQQVYEGLWEEIVARGDSLKGKRVRVEVLTDAEEKAPENPLDALVGLIPAEEGVSDLGVRHDDYLYPRR
ncbi:MAG: hypothetical protein NZ843_02360 [Fimbriimonadales bacterium]|nr:hypothetical protein [Fimbriimonadales bacterium]